MAGAVAWTTPLVHTLPAAAQTGSTGTTTTTSTAPPPTPQLLGVHTFAAAQPTAWGRRLQEMAVFDGIVFVGYGDWNANSGPIRAGGWDIAGAAMTYEAALDTECTWVHRVIGNRLVVPFIDPKANTGDLAVRSVGSSVWTTLPIGAGTAGSYHVFDAATYDGTDLWVAGARIGSSVAVVWHSPSGNGGDWVEALTYTPPAGNFARYVQLVTYGGRLYVIGYHYDGVNPAVVLPAQAWNGATWVAAPEYNFDGVGSRFGFRPMVFDGQVVRRATWPPTYAAFPFYWFDAATFTSGPQQVIHHNLDGAGRLWWIDQTLAVRRRSPGGSDQFVVQAPAGASCLAVDGTDLYLGTTASEIYRVSGV